MKTSQIIEDKNYLSEKVYHKSANTSLKPSQGGGFNSHRTNVLKLPLEGVGLSTGGKIADLSYTLSENHGGIIELKGYDLPVAADCNVGLERVKDNKPDIILGDHDKEYIENNTRQELCDLAAFGRSQTSNADMVDRYKQDEIILTKLYIDLFHTGAEQAYSDCHIH